MNISKRNERNSWVKKWIKASDIYSKVRTMLRKKLNVFTSQVHKEMIPGNKRLHFEHVWSIKAILKQYNINILRDGPARNLRLLEKLIKKLLMVFDMCRRHWKLTFQGFCPGEVSGGRKNHYLNLLKILKTRL